MQTWCTSSVNGGFSRAAAVRRRRSGYAPDGGKVWRDDLDEVRIASPGMFRDGDPLPQLICSRPVFIGGGRHEAGQHGDA